MKKLPKREEGQGLVEYALILVLVAVVVIVILSQMGPAIGNIFSEIVGALNGEIASAPQGCQAFGGGMYSAGVYIDVQGDVITPDTIGHTDDACTDNGAGPAGSYMVNVSSEAAADTKCAGVGGTGVVPGSGNENGWYFCQT
jgi:pilus assembly protein Flp/PilA